MITVGFCNLKGGVGKTTSCQNLAVALAEKGKKVAVIDMDPQSNLTFSFGVEVREDQPYMLDLLNGSASWDDVIVSREGVDVVSSTLDLVMLELDTDERIDKETMLRDAIKKIDPERYDFIFCDCPPQLGIFTRNVIVAAQRLFVPLEGEFFALAGLRTLNQVVGFYRERLNPELQIGGVMMSRHNAKTQMNRMVADEISRFFGDVFFISYIRQNVSIVEANCVGSSVFSYAPRSHAVEDYRVAADEFLQKINLVRAV